MARRAARRWLAFLAAVGAVAACLAAKSPGFGPGADAAVASNVTVDFSVSVRP